MKFFSGFSLDNDEHFFTSYLLESKYTIAGFSYGAIKAFEHALKSQNRVDTLQLFSPAFFQTESEKFKKLQLRAFNKNPQVYIKQFIENCFAPNRLLEVVLNNEDIVRKYQSLEELLYYQWDIEKLKLLKERGVHIEIFVGSEDKIIPSDKVKEFFLPYATVHTIKGANHFLIN